MPRGNTLSSRAATQIWKDADKKARLCSALAGTAALDPFDGYLAGLLHNTGWTALLRAIDGFEDLPLERAPSLAHPDVVPPLLRRRDALFGALVGPWNLSPAVDARRRPRSAAAASTRRARRSARPARGRAAGGLHALAPAGQRPAGRRARLGDAAQAGAGVLPRARPSA